LNLQAFADHLCLRTEDVSTVDEIEFGHAWPRVAASVLGLNDDLLTFVDRADSGIDMFTVDSGVYDIYQCKTKEPDETGSVKSSSTYDRSGITDLERAFDFLTGQIAPTNLDVKLRKLKATFDEEIQLSQQLAEDVSESSVTINLSLILFGSGLTPAGKDAEKTLRRKIEREARELNIVAHMEILNLDSISSYYDDDMADRSKLPPMNLSIGSLGADKSGVWARGISANDFITFYTLAKDLVRASDKNGVRLFDANVRYEIRRSNVNQAISRSASTSSGIKNFHLLNNGITVTSDGWSVKGGNQSLSIRNPSIVNGCQTVRSLASARKNLSVSEEENADFLMEEFDEKCYVLVKLINRKAIDTEEVVRASNTQNAMEPRNLLSNRIEQRLLERRIADAGWFLERKDGAVDALRESKTSSVGTEISLVSTKKNSRSQRTVRSVDNRDIARAWLSYIGFSDEGQNKRKQHFQDGTSGLYRSIFLAAPRLHADSLRQSGPVMIEKVVHQADDPPAWWMLYSHHMWMVIRHLIPSANRMRVDIRKAIIQQGRQPTVRLVSERLLSDDTLRLKYALSMLDHVVLELSGYIMSKALDGHWLSPAYSKSALKVGVIGGYHEDKAFPQDLDADTILELEQESIRNDPALLAIRLAARGIQATLSKPEFKESFISSERKSRYLQTPEVVSNFVNSIDQYDTYFSEVGTLENWWSGGSPYAAVRKMISDA